MCVSVEPFYFLYGAGFTLGFSRVIFPHRGFYLWFFPWGVLGSTPLNFVLYVVMCPKLFDFGVFMCDYVRLLCVCVCVCGDNFVLHSKHQPHSYQLSDVLHSKHQHTCCDVASAVVDV